MCRVRVGTYGLTLVVTPVGPVLLTVTTGLFRDLDLSLRPQTRRRDDNRYTESLGQGETRTKEWTLYLVFKDVTDRSPQIRLGSSLTYPSVPSPLPCTGDEVHLTLGTLDDIRLPTHRKVTPSFFRL